MRPIAGSPRVDGDEEEEDTDDLENEFDIGINDRRDPHQVTEALLAARLNTGRGSHSNVSGLATPSEFDSASVVPEIPLLTYGEEDVGISSDKHALIIPPFRGKRIHPMPFPDSSMSLPPRPMDPNKDLAVYGYGTVAWKERMEEWKKRQSDKLQVVKHQGGKGGENNGGDELDDPDLPMQALYGYDAPVKKKPPGRTCNCLPRWCCCCCRSKKKNKKSKSKSNEKKKSKEASKQIHALENIEEGIEGIDNEKSALMPQIKFEKKFGQSSVFIAATLMEDGGVPKGASSASLLKEAIHVISCGYEDKTEWGKEIGWIYGSVTEDILTGFKMHCHGWRSVYCMPKIPAFKGSAPINLSDRLHQVLRWALGSVEILLSRHCPIWYGYGCGLKWLERFSYINSVVYPLTSIPLIAYCTLPAVCLLTGKFIVPEISNYASIIFMALFISIAATGILEMQWGGVGIHDWWRNEQFWVIGGASSHLFALFQGLLKVLAGVNTNFTVTSKAADDGEFSELYLFKWTSLLIPPMTLLIINIIGVVVGISDAINNGYETWGPLFGKLFFALWVIVHLYPFLKGLIGKQDRLPTIIVVWSILLASVLTLLWVRINPFVSKGGIVLEICGLNCD
ncbi:hypothetical protein POTOM_021704 [Populus tomentosa]|uniref:Cellulose synthase n=1 Tax=Populus tomentosa TaxID=118781 RepID=A0A8X8CSQ8_POPTO|nr:hypothetical protein POTOM_021704 [Populus tomentosa]